MKESLRVTDGFAPFVDVLHRVILPPRGPAGSKQNKKRKLLVAAAVHQQKVRMAGKCTKRRCVLCRVGVSLRKRDK
jgi:hypothetical protein